MLHDSCMFCTGLGRSVPYALGLSYRITDARRGFASVKLMVVGLSGRLTSFVGLWVGMRLSVMRRGPHLLGRVRAATCSRRDKSADAGSGSAPTWSPTARCRARSSRL